MNRFLKSTTALITAASLVISSSGLALAQVAGLTEEELVTLQQQVREDATLSEADKAARLDEIKTALKEKRQAARKEERKAEKKEERKAERQAAKAAEQAQQQEPAATEQPQQTEQAQEQTQQQTQQQPAQTGEPQAEDPVANEKAAMEQAKREERRAERRAERKAEREAARAQGNVLPADAQAQADAAAEQQQQSEAVAATGDAQGEVTTDTVTEDEVRSAEDEFTATAAPKKDDGLSKAQKLALFGIGALAVGALLKNGDKVVSNTGDRVVVQTDDGYRVLKDDDILLRRPGSQVQTETFRDGSTRTRVAYADGSQVVTIRAADGRVLRRTKVLADGREVQLFDDTRTRAPVQVAQLPTPQQNYFAYNDTVSQSDLQAAMQATGANPYDRSFSLAQIRNIDAVRRLVPEIAVDNIRFNTGSAAIRPQQAQSLATLGSAIRAAIQANPAEVFLIEGHTDAVGGADMNLALSDRRAETVALALSQYFEVPPENLVVQGYGEADLKVPTYDAEQANRRVAVR
ncbi:MAG: OmpA family protein, partial [Roseivivax sp.]|nr:OmpA family protein [Roseivivax sp.]